VAACMMLLVVVSRAIALIIFGAYPISIRLSMGMVTTTEAQRLPGFCCNLFMD